MDELHPKGTAFSPLTVKGCDRDQLWCRCHYGRCLKSDESFSFLTQDLDKASHLYSFNSPWKRDPSRTYHPLLPDRWAELPANSAHLHSAVHRRHAWSLTSESQWSWWRDDVRSPSWRVSFLQAHILLIHDLSEAAAHLLAGHVSVPSCFLVYLFWLQGEAATVTQESPWMISSSKLGNLQSLRFGCSSPSHSLSSLPQGSPVAPNLSSNSCCHSLCHFGGLL